MTLAEASWLALATLRVLQVARIRPPQASGLAISSVTMLHYHAPMMKKWKLNEATKKHHGSQLQRLNASMHAQCGRGTLEVHVAELVADLPPATPWRVRRAQHELRLAKARVEPLDLLAVLPRSNHRRGRSQSDHRGPGGQLSARFIVCIRRRSSRELPT